MIIEPLYKSKELINFGWKPAIGVDSYNVYVGLASTTLTLLVTGIPNIPSKVSTSLGKIPFDAAIQDVRDLLGLTTAVDFTNRVFYFAVTAVTGILESTPVVVEVPPVGVIPRMMKDDPSINRHVYYFSMVDQKWVKAQGSTTGAVITDTSDFFKSNITTEYTYDASNVATMKSYPSDATTPGSPAKLTTYTYSGGLVSKVQITDSTV